MGGSASCAFDLHRGVFEDAEDRVPLRSCAEWEPPPCAPSARAPGVDVGPADDRESFAGSPLQGGFGADGDPVPESGLLPDSICAEALGVAEQARCKAEAP